MNRLVNSILNSKRFKVISLWIIMSCIISGINYLIYKNIISGILFILGIICLVTNFFFCIYNNVKEKEKNKDKDIVN